ncbi:MAG: acyl-CoA synthetase, partial [Acidimicrobiia bacterium]|nr:acyl-CoA synthetase [Acidimicrobiia bacterium]
GWWDGSTLQSVLDAGLKVAGANRFAVHSKERPYDGTMADVAGRAWALAAGLSQRGIRSGDVVAFQLPNWMEAAASFWGLTALGVTLLPIPHFYGPHELRHILVQSGARVLITAATFGRRDFVAELEAVRGDVAQLELVVVVGGGTLPTWAVDFDEVAASDPVAQVWKPVSPQDAAVIGYTSGTGASPKGAVLTHRALAFETVFHMGRYYQSPRVLLNSSPVTHMAGMLVALLAPIVRNEPIHLIDRWDPDAVLAAMRADDLTSGWGAAIFLTSLLDHPDITAEDIARIHPCYMGGSPIPAALVERADELGIWIGRGYGMTEQPTVSWTLPADSLDKRARTNGPAMVGVEIKVVDADGVEVPRGVAGELLVRGPDRSSGYLDPRLSETAFDADGWFTTGDIGLLEDDGCLVITDRAKDIIIRGGENISAAEVEEMLLSIPGIAEVAVVAGPDPRYGERACAFVRTKPGVGSIELDAVRAHLQRLGLSRQKWPETIRTVEELPRTPSGKIKKAELRQQLRAEAAHSSTPAKKDSS